MEKMPGVFGGQFGGGAIAPKDTGGGEAVLVGGGEVNGAVADHD